MIPPVHSNHSIVAIGGIGGSGTRIGAAMLQLLGHYIGDDLNGALDNLWFTLLFKRRAILIEPRAELAGLVGLFVSRMSGKNKFSSEDHARVLRLVNDRRLQHPAEWLRERAQSFLASASTDATRDVWGWKEPNTHIIVDQLLELHSGLRYVHFNRHPLDMAFSSNKNQLQLWGPILLNKDVALDPRHALAYWCAVHRRMRLMLERWPARTMLLDFDGLCSDPARHAREMAAFIGATLPASIEEKMSVLIDRERGSRGRPAQVDLTQFDANDLAYIESLGYAVD